MTTTKKLLLILSLIAFALPAYAQGRGSGQRISGFLSSCTTVSSGSGASPQTATCAAGFYLTGGSCTNSVAADACLLSTVTGGLAGAVTATSAAGNVNATAYCCH